MEISLKIWEATSYMTGDLGIFEILENVYGNPTWKRPKTESEIELEKRTEKLFTEGYDPNKPIELKDPSKNIDPYWTPPVVGSITDLQKWESTTTGILTRNITRFDQSRDSYYYNGRYVTPTYEDFYLIYQDKSFPNIMELISQQVLNEENRLKKAKDIESMNEL